MEIRGTVVLITGASAGIGLATARRFAREGARLALVARSAEALNRLAEELRGGGTDAIALPADLCHPAQMRLAVEQAVKHFGRLDILINNAGQSAVGPIADLALDDFRQIVDLNLYAPFVGMQAAIPVMRAQGGGIIINVSSMTSKMKIPGIGAYAATKAALNLLTDTARELAPEHIRVINVLPRITATDFSKHSLGDRERHQRMHARPNAPVDTPEYVAEKILLAAVEEPEEMYMG